MRMGDRDGVFPWLYHAPAAAKAAARRSAAVLAVVVLVATGAAPSALAAEAVRAGPAKVPAGATVTVTGTGFPAATAVDLGAGPPHSDYEVVDAGQTDATGGVSFRVRLDDEAPIGTLVVFVIATRDFAFQAASPPVEVIGAPEFPTARAAGFPGS